MGIHCCPSFQAAMTAEAWGGATVSDRAPKNALVSSHDLPNPNFWEDVWRDLLSKSLILLVQLGGLEPPTSPQLGG